MPSRKQIIYTDSTVPWTIRYWGAKGPRRARRWVETKQIDPNMAATSRMASMRPLTSYTVISLNVGRSFFFTTAP